jgi:hypothetical protein
MIRRRISCVVCWRLYRLYYPSRNVHLRLILRECHSYFTKRKYVMPKVTNHVKCAVERINNILLRRYNRPNISHEIRLRIISRERVCTRSSPPRWPSIRAAPPRAECHVIFAVGINRLFGIVFHRWWFQQAQPPRWPSLRAVPLRAKCGVKFAVGAKKNQNPPHHFNCFPVFTNRISKYSTTPIGPATKVSSSGIKR